MVNGISENSGLSGIICHVPMYNNLLCMQISSYWNQRVSDSFLLLSERQSWNQDTGFFHLWDHIPLPTKLKELLAHLESLGTI